MIPSLVLPMIGNLLKDLVMDKAQDLAKEHLEDAIEKNPWRGRWSPSPKGTLVVSTEDIFW